MRPIEICLYRSLLQVEGARVTLTWPELMQALSTPHVFDRKDASHGWSAGLPEDDTRGQRCEGVSLLVYDVDGPLPELALPVEAFAHSTFSHSPDNPRWRLVVLTDRPHSPAEHRQIWLGAAQALGLDASLDESTKDPVRFFYAPSHPPGAKFETRHFAGQPLHVDRFAAATVTALATLPRAAPAQATPAAPVEAGAIDLERYRERVGKMRYGDTRAKLKALLDGGELPHQGGRNSWMHSAFSAMGAMAWGEDIATVLAEDFARRLELAPGETREEWKSLALGSWRRAFDARKHRDALNSTFATLLQQAPADDWRHQLITRTNKEGEKTVDSSGFNVSLILQHDPAFASLRWNVMRFEVEAQGGPLSGVPRGSLDTALADWLYNAPEYRIKVSREDAAARLMLVARSRPYDPVQEYLNGLPAWDGHRRIGSVLTRLCGCIDNDYTRGVSRKFFIGAVARAMEPGCQLDTVLLLHGPQGLGKTSFVRAVGGPFMAELHMDPSAKDTLQTIAGRWFVELSELASARRTDVETMRAFITRRTDVLRLPYGRIIEEFPRRCVFVGTTNDDTPLRDTHGSRRYWPVTVGRVNVEALVAERDQLFAEALVAYRAGEKWWFDAVDQEMADREAELYTEADVWQEYIREWWEKLAERPKQITLMEVARRALLLDPNSIGPATAARIGRALNALGFKKTTRGRGAKSSLYNVPNHQSILEKL